MKSRATNPGRGLVAIGLALMLLAGSAVAGEKVERSGEASATGMVYIENMVGSIEVIGWDKKEVKLEGTLGKDVEDLEFETGKKKTVIEVIYPRKAKNLEDGADLVIHVPRGSGVQIEGVSAWVKVTDVDGQIEASSVSGNVDVTGGKDTVEAESISGAVTVVTEAGEVEVESISGRVSASGEKAEIEAASVSGDIKVSFKKLLSMSVETVSGTIDVSGELNPKGEFSFDTVSGSVTLLLAGDVNASFQVSTFSGGIDNDFGQKARKTSRYAPGKELEFSVGGGDAEVEVNTFSGNVRIKRK
jgi:DUF4097 and DUF4098 domain-containing protein YvlB